jgi:hypothetical protein
VGSERPRYRKDKNITVKPAGGSGREIAPGKITFPSSEDINPRLRDLFSSRLVTVDATQSPGLTIELDGAGGAGAGGGAFEALPFGREEEDLAAAPPLVELAAAARFFFFTIARSGCNSSGGGAVAVKKGRRGRMRRCCGSCGRDWGFFALWRF